MYIFVQTKYVVCASECVYESALGLTNQDSMTLRILRCQHRIYHFE